ncbi:MAG: beta-ketoacyl-[acyl-carrier-protein] synthase II [Clostridiales bacterium GWF2_38_85]|nr:MAG: beta-ketoacyl-[acyl-carrier-protein] synthase II [Clostridiales bacterium GWF2_38_85]HBL85243.1 beta-ketoacyl-[acyl-carrier-protein] synthase II [Clostridiales bacterium]
MQRVVITGIGVISPVGNDINSFWNSLSNGISGIDFITRFDTTDIKIKTDAEVKDFDPKIYFADKSEIRKSDLYTQYAYAAAVQAMADSNLIDYENTRLGVYVGSGIGGMATFYDESIKLYTKGASRVSPHFIPMMIGNMATGMISIKFKAMGPTLPVVTACATSSNTIGEAYLAIKYGRADAIIAGGSEAAINPLAIAGFANCFALSESTDPKRSSIPFDKERNGFVMGEGAGILILEEYNHAVARGAKIYAEVCGYGNTSDAYHVTAPHPDALGATNAIDLAKKEANITENDKIYINAHGTSTHLNDKAETLAIKNVFGKKAYEIMISSTKSMTGHMLGAAGAVEAIASVLALNNGILPPTIGYQVPDEECDLDYVPNQARKVKVDFVLSTSLGFGGHNVCLVFKPLIT